jgi:hypothetical protein
VSENEIIEYLMSLQIGDRNELICMQELIGLDNNSKMIIFAMDNGDKNRIESKQFEQSTFEINGLADYSKEFIFDKLLFQVVNSDNQEWGIPIGHQFNIDLNIGKLINTFINQKRELNKKEQQVIDYLLKDVPKIPINVMSFIQERKTHKKNIEDKSLYQILLSIAQFEKMRELGFNEITNPNESISTADKWWRVVCAKNDDLQQDLDIRYFVLYNFLLKVVSLQIEYGKKKDFEKKKNFLIEFINNQLYIYPENEFWYALKLFSGEEFARQIFNKFSNNKSAEENINRIKNMAWDLFHIRLTEMILEEETISYNKVVLPLFVSEDKQINNYIKFNPVKKIVFFKNKMYLSRENNALSELNEEEFINFSNGAFKRKENQRKLSIDYLKDLSCKLEAELKQLCD